MTVKDFIKMIEPFSDKELGLIVFDCEEQRNIRYENLGIKIPNVDNNMIYIIEPYDDSEKKENL